jgi:hypothetical protein
MTFEFFDRLAHAAPVIWLTLDNRAFPASGRRAAASCRTTRTSAQLAQEAFAILGHWGSNADATDPSASRLDFSSDNRLWM